MSEKFGWFLFWRKEVTTKRWSEFSGKKRFSSRVFFSLPRRVNPTLYRRCRTHNFCLSVSFSPAAETAEYFMSKLPAKVANLDIVDPDSCTSTYWKQKPTINREIALYLVQNSANLLRRGQLSFGNAFPLFQKRKISAFLAFHCRLLFSPSIRLSVSSFFKDLNKKHCQSSWIVSNKSYLWNTSIFRKQFGQIQRRRSVNFAWNLWSLGTVVSLLSLNEVKCCR